MSTKTALWIVGGAVLAFAVFYAFKGNASAAANTAGMVAAPPPALVGGAALLSSRPLGGYTGPVFASGFYR